MKKVSLLAVLWFVMVSLQVEAQSKPFIGYDKVAWGASVEDVRKTYDIGDSIALTIGKEDTNIARLTQKDVSGSIKERIFMFNKWNSNSHRLYRVWVTYSDSKDDTHITLKTRLQQVYGAPTDSNSRVGEAKGYGAISVIYSQEIIIFGKFSPEIEVELWRRSTGNPPFTGNRIDDAFYRNEYASHNFIQVCYTWKKFRDDYQASKVGL